MPEALANSVSLTVDDPYQIADGYSTSTAYATVDGVGDGESVDFTISDSNGDSHVSATTNSSGVASIPVGPYPYGTHQDVTVTASDEGTNSNSEHVIFLAKNKLKILSISPGTTTTVGTWITVTAQWDVSTGNPATNVPLTFAAYDPNFAPIGSPQVKPTDGSGITTYTFLLSDIAGYNWVTMSLNGVTIKSLYVVGTGGNINQFNLYTTPVSPIYADGKTNYVLHVTALDAKGNTVAGKNVSIYKNGIKYVTYPTNSNGVIALSLGSSLFVQDINITAVADDTLAKNSINISYIKGIASNISIMANPPVVANANISTVPGQADVHTTEIISTLTDNWGHPIPGETVYITSLNNSLGSMYDTTNKVPVPVVSGITDSSGQFAYNFTLASTVKYSDIDIGVPVLTWYNNSTTGVNTSAICFVRFTDKPFVVATTSYSPMNNLSVNDTINVTVKLRAYGWINATNNNNSAMLVFDTSGSMDWLANTIYPNYDNGSPQKGYINPATNTALNGWLGVDPDDWQHIMDYSYTGDGTQDLQIMLSSDYRAYNNGTGSFYYLKVVKGTNVYHTDKKGNTIGNGVAMNASNENSVLFTNAQSGTYQIYGAYIKNGNDTPYNLMILTDPKRLGQSTDLNSAAKVAGTQFVSLMDKNQVGVVWFNDTAPIPPVAKFTGTPLAGNAPLTVQFTDASDNSPSEWYWSFGDSSASIQQSPSHTYYAPGTYNVQLTAHNQGGNNSVTYYNYVTVHHPAPTPSFYGTPTTGYAPLTVNFYENSGDSSITSWQWNFGDLTANSTAQNPVHVYANPGTYTVTLTETNDGGTGTKTLSNYITVVAHSAPPVANFIASPTTGYVNYTTYTFTDKSTGSNINSWQWNFGDGTANATTQNPTHKFTTTGTFTVTLTVTNDGGSGSVTKTSYVTVWHNALPVANFTGSPTSGTAPLTVTFTDKSTGNGIYLRQWSWGDGTANGTYTIATNPTHKYTVAGTYTVTLTVTNDAGSSTLQRVSYITVNPAATATATATATPQPPVVDFTGTPTSGYAPLSVAFTDKSTNAPTSWSWNFGDSGTSTSKNPTHVYNNPGVYTVSLTATNSAGSGSKTKTNYITVNAHNASPVANFVGTPLSGLEPLTVQFTDQSTGNNINSWAWVFGDGGTSTSQNPSHIYANAGVYTVKLTVKNDNATAGVITRTNYINVTHNAPPVADFTMNPPSGNVPLTVTFNDASSGNNIYSWSWNFSDGQWSTQRNPIVTFSNTGTIVARLTVTNDGGSSSINKTITVSHNTLPTASFVGVPVSGNIPLNVQFTDMSSGNNIYAWAWDFGDYSGNSSSQSPSHTYSSEGVYSVTLTVWNDAGTSTIKMKNYIYAYNPEPTIPPMLTGILDNLLRTFTMEANAGGTAPMTPPSGLSIGLTTINGATAVSVNNSIDILMSNGGTNIAAGITEAISEFNSANYSSGNKKYIVLLTDGYSQHPPDDITAAHQAASQNITIYTVGIGMPDDDTLQNIAGITGGTYTKVDNMPDLIAAFSDIANQITDVAGHNITLCTFTNYSNITYTLTPDTTYVNGSSNVLMPDPISKKMTNYSIEPALFEDDANHVYRLTWPNIGNLSYNQNMTITYQLKVMTAGNITPITNASYVGFLDDDGNLIQSGFSGPTLYVNGSSNDTPSLAPPDLTVAIITPTDNSTINASRMLVSWTTTYTGADTYNQMVKLNGVPILPLPPNGYSSGVTQPWSLSLDVSDLPSGTIPLEISAYDSYCNSTAIVNITIDHSSGRIQLGDG